ncbi:MAG: type VI secretion system-associated protein TagF [Pseudomonadota bacterium]
MLATNSLTAGWYGKIPALGDFASRRISRQFIVEWDAWLQHGIAASRASLGQDWLDAYLHSPIWRFALLPGVIGPTAWAGLLMSSVDKVGRHFPLTIAVALDEQLGATATTEAAQRWYAALENVALSTLNINFSLEQLESALTELPFPTSNVPSSDLPLTSAYGKSLWWTNTENAAFCHFSGLPPQGQFANLLEDTMLSEALLGQ